MLLALGTAACGDRCDQLCDGVGTKLEACRPASLTWNDVGARSEENFVRTCRDDWDRVRSLLASAQASAALEACEDTTATLDELSCEELVAIYATE